MDRIKFMIDSGSDIPPEVADGLARPGRSPLPGN